MIGAQAYYEFLAGTLAGPDLNAAASKAIDSYGAFELSSSF